MNTEITGLEACNIIRKRVAIKMGDIYPACEDVGNEAMFRFVKATKEGKFKYKSELKTYIISITDCVIADYFRKVYKENPANLSFLWDSASNTLAAIEVKEIIDESLKVLSDEQRKAIIFTEILGMSRGETAKKMGITKERVTSIKADAKWKMKRRLVKMGFGVNMNHGAKERIEWLGKFYRAYESMCMRSNHGNAPMLHDAKRAYAGIKERLKEK